MNDQLTTTRKFLKPKYYVLGFLLSILIYLWFEGEHHFLFGVDLLALVSFAAIINRFLRNKEQFNYERLLLLYTTTYASIFIVLFKFVSFYYSEDYYVFSNIDAALYQRVGRQLSNESFQAQLNYLTRNWGTDDWGAFMLSSLLYTIWDSPFNFAVFYLLIGVSTAILVFRIGCRIMPEHYAFLAALTFALSSFTITFQSTYLKETFMLFLIVLSYYGYYQFLHYRKSTFLLAIALGCGLLVLFRPALIIFIFISFVMPRLFTQKMTYKQIFVILVVLVAFFAFGTFVESQTTRYRITDDVETVRQDMIRGGLTLTYFVNVLAGLFGPIPTIVPHKPLVALYFPGLMFRVMTGFAFCVGLISVFRTRDQKVIPLAVYTVSEIIILVWILEALELRKSFPHFPFIYIIVFWLLYMLDAGKFKGKIRQRILHFNSLYLAAIVVIIIIWNSRFS
jgi:hypothetical protein